MSYSQTGAILIALFASLLVAGCDVGGGAKVGCTSDASKAVILDLVRQEVERKASRELRQSDRQLASPANLRASLALIQFVIDDIRTSKEDPDSTKKFCAGSFKATIPANMLADAERTYELLEIGTVTDYAEQRGVKASANIFSYDLEFSVQPTDDGAKIFGEIEHPDSLVGFLSGVVVAHLATGQVQQAKADSDQAELEQQRLNAAAEVAQKKATLTEARTEHDLARQTLTVTWDALSEADQANLTANQTAWNQSKRADCNLEAGQYSTDPTEREASRMRCDARMTRERVAALRSHYGVY